ncbi:hypothetical protein [Roseibium salinum]|uniref:Uncharacterized protein n=1 Tax=Roseibium salinum TaxID=1604349 RepID=A0ABT3R057_9HYPH|nr:hypothetical protein [Roseibium sp. DSM 29163]MCX2722480.1 hypothetical protein [Roseibium sp. DSM 29163]MDN3719554.1 hypothetical protein [Roseibium salinum]
MARNMFVLAHPETEPPCSIWQAALLKAFGELDDDASHPFLGGGVKSN